MLSYWIWCILSDLSKVSTKFIVLKKNLSKAFYDILAYLENCGVGPVSRGQALGFRHVAKGSDAKILDVSTGFGKVP